MQPLRHIKKTNINEHLWRKAKRRDEHPCKKLIIAFGVDSKGNVISIQANAPPETHQTFFGKKIRSEEKSMKRHRVGRHAEERVMKKCGGKGIDKIYVVQVVETSSKKMKIQPVEPCEKCLGIAAKLGIELIPWNGK